MTANQIKTFWPKFAAACRNLGLRSKEERDEYRLRLMWDADRAQHLADVSNGAGYERLMAAVASDAGDFATAVEVAGGASRRQAALIDDCVRQVFELSGKTGDRRAYARSILSNAGVTVPDSPDWYQDIPEATFLKVFYSLDGYRRSLVRRRSVELGHSLRITYKYGTSYL